MIHSSPLSDIVVPAVSLPEHVLGDISGRASRIAVVDGVTGMSLSYAEFDESSTRTAWGLLDAGLGPGDVVALISQNQPAYAVAVYAVLRAGATLMPLNPVLTVAEINKQLADSGARAVIFSDDVADKIDEAVVGTSVSQRYSLEGTGEWTLSALAAATPVDLPDVDPDSVALLPYSSGTTGTSKGVMLTHRNLVANLEQVRAAWSLAEDEVLCAALPLFHIFGFTIIMNSALLAGATVVTLPRFELAAFLNVVQRYRVTRGHVAPPILLALAQAPDVDSYDLSSMKVAVCGAAPLDALTAQRVQERTGIRVVQGYGMTEASPGTHAVIGDDPTVPADSVGKLLPSTEARVVRPDTEVDAAPGESGELWVRGPQVMRGYFNRPEATAETLTDGWLRTGDIVEVRDGNFYVVDRLKELIKYNGYQVPPAELEAVLLGHPMVRDAAVVGVHHPVAGEAPKAFVVANGELTAEELLAWTAERVAPYKKIREVEFVSSVPKSPTGKILRRLLKENREVQNR